MNLEICQVLIGVSTYALLSFLVASYRRPLEQLLAEETLTQGQNSDVARQAYRVRVVSLDRRKRMIRRTFRYGFPRTHSVCVFVHARISDLLWPLALWFSFVFYCKAAVKPETLMEICNDL